jgi:Tol biopolymer transport system component
MAPAFAPDGKSVYFGQIEGSGPITIVASYLKNGAWTSPVAVPFSGGYPNLEPAFDPHGKYLIFASSRPATSGDSLINGNWNGKAYPGKGGNLWKVNYSKKGWSEPVRLPEVINKNSSVFSPAVTGDGSLYFMRADSGGSFHIYRSQFANGQYQQPIRASFCMDKYGDFDPAVAPNESFLIFSSPRPPAPKTSDLFIVFRTPKGWSEPIDLRQSVSDKVFGVEARLSPDLKTLYFTNQINKDGVKVPTDSYIWQVDISKLLKEHGVLK